MVNSLVQLKELKICSCKLIEGVIVEEEERTSKMLFPKLYELKLKDLPKLSRFGTGNLFEFPSLNELWIDSCPNLQSFIPNSKCKDITVIKEPEHNLEISNSTVRHLFDEKVAFPSLVQMILSHLETLQMVWHHQLHEDSFSKLQVVRVKHCEKLLTIVPSNALGRLSTLEILRISDCATLKSVVECQGLNVLETTAIEDERISKILFPKLRTLKLKALPSLNRFCNSTGDFIGLSSLSHLWVVNCPNMKTFISSSICPDITARREPEGMNSENFDSGMQPLFDKKVRLPSLEELIIQQMDELTEIWDNQLSLDSFSKLKPLGVAFCNKLQNIFPSNMLGRHQILEKLTVKNYDSLEERFKVLDKSSCIEDETIGKDLSIFFPQLTTLYLKMLPSLSTLYPGLQISELPLLNN